VSKSIEHIIPQASLPPWKPPCVPEISEARRQGTTPSVKVVGSTGKEEEEEEEEEEKEEEEEEEAGQLRVMAGGREGRSMR